MGVTLRQHVTAKRLLFLGGIRFQQVHDSLQHALLQNIPMYRPLQFDPRVIVLDCSSPDAVWELTVNRMGPPLTPRCKNSPRSKKMRHEMIT
jgi:hypothetical protein